MRLANVSPLLESVAIQTKVPSMAGCTCSIRNAHCIPTRACYTGEQGMEIVAGQE